MSDQTWTILVGKCPMSNNNYSISSTEYLVESSFANFALKSVGSLLKCSSVPK